MKRKKGSILVIIYLLFLTLLTIEIIFQTIQKNTTKQSISETMVFQVGDSDALIKEEVSRNLKQTVSEPRTLEENELVRIPVYDLNDEDYNNLLKIVEAEAGCEDENGKLLVANVVLNRTESEKFPASVTDVVYQANGGKVQFTPAYNGRLQSVKISKQTENAVERAVYGEDISDGALFFVAASVAGKEKSSWFYNNLNHLFDYGGHSFFK